MLLSWFGFNGGVSVSSDFGLLAPGCFVASDCSSMESRYVGEIYEHLKVPETGDANDRLCKIGWFVKVFNTRTPTLFNFREHIFCIDDCLGAGSVEPIYELGILLPCIDHFVFIFAMS